MTWNEKVRPSRGRIEDYAYHGRGVDRLREQPAPRVKTAVTSRDRVDAVEILDFPKDSETVVLAELALSRRQRSPLLDQVQHQPNLAVSPGRQNRVESMGSGGLHYTVRNTNVPEV